MTLQVRVHPEWRLVHWRALGVVQAEDIVAEIGRIYRANDASLDEFIDTSAVERFALDPDGMRRVIAAYRRVDSPGAGRSAVWAPHQLPFALGRMGMALSENQHRSMRVFRQASDALAWLGHDAEVVAALLGP